MTALDLYEMLSKLNRLRQRAVLVLQENGDRLACTIAPDADGNLTVTVVVDDAKETP